MQDLHSPNRDGTLAPCNGSILTTGPPGKSLHFLFLISKEKLSTFYHFTIKSDVFFTSIYLQACIKTRTIMGIPFYLQFKKKHLKKGKWRDTSNSTCLTWQMGVECLSNTFLLLHLFQGKVVGCKRMITSQVSGESLGWAASVGSWLPVGKNSRVNHSKVKAGLFRDIHTPQTECGPSQKARGPRVQGCYFLWAR